MKKVILAGLVASVFSGAVFADAATDLWTSAPADKEHDSAQVTASWIGMVPTVLPGKWITFTGAAGGAIKSGTLKIAADGLFETEQPVTLELHTFDPASNTTGDLLPIGTEIATGAGVKVDTVNYTVSEVDFESQKGAALTGAQGLVKLDGTVMSPTVPFALPSSTTTWTVESKDASSGFGHVIANDRISAFTNVTADIDFTAA